MRGVIISALMSAVARTPRLILLFFISSYSSSLDYLTAAICRTRVSADGAVFHRAEVEVPIDSGSTEIYALAFLGVLAFYSISANLGALAANVNSSSIMPSYSSIGGSVA